MNNCAEITGLQERGKLVYQSNLINGASTHLLLLPDNPEAGPDLIACPKCGLGLSWGVALCLAQVISPDILPTVPRLFYLD